MSVLIWGASQLWSFSSALARVAVDRKLLRSEKLPSRVVSVGNIQAGGAGKTPLVALIANEAARRKLRVCILTRGYGGEWESGGGMICPTDAAPDPHRSGDEAALLHDLAPDAWIGVGADRLASYRAVAARAGGVELAILDDGFQHWKIRKDVEVIAVTGATPSQRLFRDWPGALARASVVVWTKGPMPEAMRARTPEAMRARTPEAMRAPVVRVRYQLPDGQGRRVHLVTGVADGDSVAELAGNSGYKVEKHFSYPDHAAYDRGRIDSILEEARAQSCRVCVTGKDWVKWRHAGVAREDVLVVEPELHFDDGREIWEKTLWGS